MAKSLLFSTDSPLTLPPGCGPGRQEVAVTIRKHGRLYTLKMRDKVFVEDPFLVLVKAEAFALQNGEPFAGVTPPRALRDVLIKNNINIA
jgi:hypothetical protein